MRRLVVFFVALLMIFLIFLILGRRARDLEVSPLQIPGANTLAATSPKKQAENPDEAIASADSRKPDGAAARRALGRALGTQCPGDMFFLAYGLEEMHDGAYPEYRKFARDFLAAAGSDVVPIVESLLAECKSREARYLLISVLGDARRPEALPLLKGLLENEPDRGTVRTALFSIGMANTDEGFEFLTEFIRSGRAGTPMDPNNHLAAAVAALGQQGVRSLDFLLEEARKQTAERESPNPNIIGGVRGKDAVRRLQSLARTDSDPMIRLGAAMALASTTDSEQLESLASLDPAAAGRALLAARNRPDIWNDSAATRRKIAERIFGAAGPPSGDYQKDSALLEAAMFLPPDRTRSLMESLVAKPPRNKGQEDLMRFVAAFADQPDVIPRAHELGKAWGLSESECEYMVDEGTRAGALPGRQLHPATLERLFQIVGDSASQEWQRQQAMSSIMLSGVPEVTQTEALSRIWSQPLTLRQRREILTSLATGAQSSMPSKGAFLGAKPERFLTTILNETSEPTLQAPAAYACYCGGFQSTDPVLQRTLDGFLRFSTASTVGGDPENQGMTSFFLFNAVVAHFAKYGTSADLPALSRRGADFVSPLADESQKEKAARSIQQQLNYAIDAIRLRGN
jgi:HEAT repeat protein